MAEEATTREVPLRQSPRKRASTAAASPAKPIMNSLDMLAQVAAKLQDPGLEEDGSIPNKKEAEPSPVKPSPKEKTKNSVKQKSSDEDGASTAETESPDEKPTAEERPASKLNKTPKKVTKRSIQSLEEVTLCQIQSLSSKAVISLFSEMTANEMTRNYTYTCYLMPEECQESVSSFGNEMKARNAMITHLMKHIENLADIKKDPETVDKKEFVAIPITVRRKKEAEAAKKKKRGIISGPESASKRRRSNKSKFTALKAGKTEEDLERETSDDHQPAEVKTERPVSPASSDSENEGGSLILDRPRKKKADKQSTALSSKVDDSGTSSSHGMTSASASMEDVALGSSSSKGTNRKVCKSPHAASQTGTQAQGGMKTWDQEQMIIDAMNHMQPFLDHSYTTIFGKRYKSDESFVSHSSSDGEEEEEDEDELSDSASCSSAQSTEHKKSLPILPLPHFSAGDAEIPMVSSEEIIPRRGRPGGMGGAEQEGSGHSGEKPYPPMPKSALASRGRLVVPEEEGSASEAEESAAALTPKKRKKLTKGSKESHAEWEKRIALKCIRELRGRKKDDKVNLVCKICKDKSFTAGATLMYHYRSHAGIKPFVCVICNTTFTRQHSLNYHMLIHNNQSRFSCKDCGRKFRHPSHFKEHLRRHTGETPFECTECQNRFKTRNTYKRHLKTRHGKLLTVFGIHPMSKEEFLKVRTKPYKKSPSEVAAAHAHTSVQPTTPSHSLIQPRPKKIKMEQTASPVVSVSSQTVPGSTPSASVAIPSATITSPAAHTIVSAPPPPFITFPANPAPQPPSVPAHSISVAASINAPTITMASPTATYFLPPITFTTAGSGIVSMQVAAPPGQGPIAEEGAGSEDDSNALYVPIGIVEH